MADSSRQSKIEQCVLELHKVGVVKFGDFTLKSGIQSPIYFDLRIITSFPKLMRCVSELLWSVAPSSSYDHVCGVAYTGIPLATVISQEQDLPMLVRRKESKSYGLKKMVEGVFSAGDSCLIIEDVIVSGESVYETVQNLLELGLKVSEAVVFLDRQQGGVDNLAQLGVKISSVITLVEMLSILCSHGRVEQTVADEVNTFMAQHAAKIVPKDQKQPTSQVDEAGGSSGRVCQSYSERAADCSTSPLARRLLQIMVQKTSNLCIAADVDTAADLLSLAKQVGEHICLLKTHTDTLPDLTPAVISELQQLAQDMNFLLFEDRKFVDIGSTVSRQYREQGAWAHLVTAAPVLGGDGVIRGIAGELQDTGAERGVVLVAEMSSEGALRSPDYLTACRKMADDHPNLVLGFVCQSNVTTKPRLLQMTPGVSLSSKGDSLGQRYVSPEAAMKDRGADIIIVGRGVTRAEDRAAAALLYRRAAYEAYTARLAHNAA